MSSAHPVDSRGALEALIDREEVLQIAFWFQGEGLGDCFDAATLSVFLHGPRESVDAALEELARQGALEAASRGGFRFTPNGRQRAARLFAEEFADYQRPGHGECVAGCCDAEDHAQCGNDCPHHG